MRQKGRKFSISVQTQEDRPGLVLRVSGAAQHVFCTGDWSPIDESEEYGDEAQSTYNWRDNLLATVALDADWHFEERWPDQIAGNPDVVRVMRINAGHRAQCHYVAPNTVVGLEDGELQRTTTGGFVRDDRPQLKAIARTAWEWYGVTRRALSLTYKQVAGVFRAGDLICQIGKNETLQDIRTVITEVRIDLAKSEHDIHRTHVRTQFAELDPMQLWQA